MRPVILHLSNDFPDPLKPDKTRAIYNIIEATPQYRHVVYSLNRVNGLSGLAAIPFGKDRTAISYGALPKGLLWQHRLTQVATWLANDIQQKQIMPDIIQAHKLTVEGIMGYQLAQKFNCPLVCDIQGGTDVRILKAKISLRSYYRQISDYCSTIFSYAPWSITPFVELLGADRNKFVPLPVLPGFDTLTPSDSRESQKFITLMRFDDRANKNIAGTMQAMQKLASQHPNLTLDVYGGGSPAGLMELMKRRDTFGLAQQVQFKGPIPNNDLPKIMSQYAALVMPSFIETYGLVYAEALFCGIPVIYSAGRAIDGYFDPHTIGAACNPDDADNIATAIDHVLTHEDRLKQQIAHMQQSGKLNSIRRTAIISLYQSHMDQLLDSRASHAA